MNAPSISICCMFLIAGLLSVFAAICNWDWFFNSSNAKMLTGKFSRSTSRIIYFIVGCAILAMDAIIVADLSGK